MRICKSETRVVYKKSATRRNDVAFFTARAPRLLSRFGKVSVFEQCYGSHQHRIERVQIRSFVVSPVGRDRLAVAKVRSCEIPLPLVDAEVEEPKLVIIVAKGLLFRI